MWDLIDLPYKSIFKEVQNMSRKRAEVVSNLGAVTFVGIVLCFFLFSNINCGDNGIDEPQIIPDDFEVMWTENGVAVRKVDGSDAAFPVIISGGSGGAIITWDDYRDGFDTGIYAQKLDSDGNALWTENGVAVRQLAGSQATNQQITTDGAGGAIITWEDVRSGHYNIYAQRVGSGGSTLWATNGVVICNVAGSDAQLPHITTDDAGGAIITWEDGRSFANWEIYAQRVDSGGNVLWKANGVAVCDVSLSEAGEPQITADGSGGAIITWEDGRNGVNDIFANRVDASGSTQWPTQGSTRGVAVRELTGSDAGLPQITTDGAGGAIITWNDERNGAANIYANRVDANGNTQWPTKGSTTGIAICQEAVEQLQSYPMTTDGAGGAIITWQDKRSGDSNIYAQRVDSGGNTKWTTNGVAIRQLQGSDANLPQITTGGAGGAVVTWVDERRSDWLSTHQDIYAQMVDSSGNAQWTQNGVVVRGAPASDLAAFPSITMDGFGGAIITWEDGRNENVDIYAQKVSNTAVSTFKNSLGQEFKLIPAGTFTMGSPSDEPGRGSDEIQHRVTLTQPFYMQATEVTLKQWEALMGSNTSVFGGCPTCPVVYVQWPDVQAFVVAMNKLGEGTYSLPTEAQWEYAARAGSTTAFYDGKITETGWEYDPNLDAIGWYTYNSPENTQPVAGKAPNAWGLYDMSGNASEWCQDWYGSYPSSAVTDPKGPSSGSERVYRGGSFSDYAAICRSAARSQTGPYTWGEFLGFRLLREP